MLTYELFEMGTFTSEQGRFCLHAPLRTKVIFLLWHLIISNTHLLGYDIPLEAHTAFSLSVFREHALGAQSSCKRQTNVLKQNVFSNLQFNLIFAQSAYFDHLTVYCAQRIVATKFFFDLISTTIKVTIFNKLICFLSYLYTYTNFVAHLS